MEFDDAMRVRYVIGIGVAASLLGSVLPKEAIAQTAPLYAPPPSTYSIDGNGVDLTSGQFIFALPPVQIGQPGGAGIAYTRTYLQGGAWRDNITGTLSSSGSTYYVSIGPISDVFTLSGGLFTPIRNVGQTLTLSGATYTYTMSDGTTASFSQNLSDRSISSPQTLANQGRISNLTRPNGEILSFFYQIAQNTDDPGSPDYWEIRLKSVRNNYGYALALTYEFDELIPGYHDLGPWRRLQQVTAYNLTDCQSLIAPCPSATPWPSLSFSGSNITDQSGSTTYYGSAGSAYTYALRLPENPSTDAFKYTLNTNLDVISAEREGAVWNYTYTESGGVRTVVITDPASGVSNAKINIGTDLLSSYTDQLNRTTSYVYNSGGQVTRISLPRTNSINYIYDARGNVTQTRIDPPTLLLDPPPSIVTSASYPVACSNRIICNQPTSTTDALGAVTDYEYDPVHGGVTRITQPAPTIGADRPETRITYAARHAWVSNGMGGHMENPQAVTLPIAVSTCATGAAPACLGTADEVKTTVVYGATGVGNNLHPTAITQGAGDGSLTATTATTWTDRGDAASIDGPLAGADDTTTYRYDANRQVVGIIGPDPDGAGPLPRRAVRNTYDANGAVTLAEQGTVAGLTDPDWAAFASLQQTAAVYDLYGRPTHTRQQAGGVTYGLTQVAYDALGRTDCVVIRMNPDAFAAPLASACTASTTGAYGPDRIVRTLYDAASQPVSTTSGYGLAEAITESVTYTANGLPASLTDGRGNVSIQEYDGFDRSVRLRYPNAIGGETSTTDYEQVAYDAAGNVVSSRDRAGQTTTIVSDALNRPVVVDAPAGTMDVALTYDNLGRVLTSSGDGQTLTQVWDALGRLTSETGPLGAMAYRHDAAGRLTRIIWPDAFYASYDHDVYGAVNAVRENGATSGPGVLAAYAYDNLGRLTGITRGNGAATAYGYDAVSRLASLTQNPTGAAQDVTLSFTHNPAGQIVTRAFSNPAYAWASTGSNDFFNDELNRLTAIDSAALTYDADQNITGVLGNSYGYDAANRMTSATAVSGPGASSFTYDPYDRLITTTTGAASTRFQYAGQQLAAEYDAAGALIARHIPGLGLDGVVASYAGSGTTSRSWLLADERSSVIALADGLGAVTTINRYDDYGVPAAGNAGRFQYTGQQWLAEARAYHYRARTYLPQIGRFLQTDPIGYEAGANLYAYAGADPVNLVDPTGLCGNPLIPNDISCPLSDVIVTGNSIECPLGFSCIIGAGQIRDFLDSSAQLDDILVVGSGSGRNGRLSNLARAGRYALCRLPDINYGVAADAYPRIMGVSVAGTYNISPSSGRFGGSLMVGVGVGRGMSVGPVTGVSTQSTRSVSANAGFGSGFSFPLPLTNRSFGVSHLINLIGTDPGSSTSAISRVGTPVAYVNGQINASLMTPQMYSCN